MAKTNGVAVVLGTFHQDLSERMLTAATAAIEELGLHLVALSRVPGSYEKPLATKRLLLRPDVDGVIVLGIIERGETAHGLVMGQSVSNALVQLQLEFMKPIGIGIIGPEVFPSQIPARLESHAVAAVAACAAMLQAAGAQPDL